MKLTILEGSWVSLLTLDKEKNSMAYEDTFKSVRETGPKPGTSPDPNRKDPNTETAELPNAPDATPATGRTERIAEQKATLEELRQESLAKAQSEADELRAQAKAAVTPSRAFPSRPIGSILSDMRRVLADTDNLFEGDKNRSVPLFESLITEAEIAAERMENLHDHLQKRMTDDEYQ